MADFMTKDRQQFIFTFDQINHARMNKDQSAGKGRRIWCRIGNDHDVKIIGRRRTKGRLGDRVDQIDQIVFRQTAVVCGAMMVDQLGFKLRPDGNFVLDRDFMAGPFDQQAAGRINSPANQKKCCACRQEFDEQVTVADINPVIGQGGWKAALWSMIGIKGGARHNHFDHAAT